MYTKLAVLLVLGCFSAFAMDTCKIENIKSFYSRVKSSGPSLAEAFKRKEVASSSVDVAKQRPNPEMELEYIRGDEFGLEVNTYSLTAKHIIELGAKRDKRLRKAESYKKLKESEVDLSLFNSNLDATIGYQRVAQLNITIDAVKEAIQTFDRITKKLSSRKRLNPEETVSLSTLRLASNDYKAQLNDLENEKTLLTGKISFFSNCKSVEAQYEYLAYKKIKFGNSNSEKTGLAGLEDLKVDVEVGELGVQKSIGYSDLAIGPTFQYQGQGNDEFLSAGISLSFALPLFQTNDGGKLNALKNLAAQKTKTGNRKKMLKIERINLIEKFNRSLKTLSSMPRLAQLEANHKKVDKLFSRGVV
jgi:cobalt-zinc-cadmium efflux system outer membrane protein